MAGVPQSRFRGHAPPLGRTSCLRRPQSLRSQDTCRFRIHLLFDWAQNYLKKMIPILRRRETNVLGEFRQDVPMPRFMNLWERKMFLLSAATANLDRRHSENPGVCLLIRCYRHRYVGRSETDNYSP